MRMSIFGKIRLNRIVALLPDSVRKMRGRHRRCLIFILGLLFVSGLPSAEASFFNKIWNNENGRRLYIQGDHGGALEKFESALTQEPESATLNFNAGTALYKRGKFDEAVTHFQKSLLGDDQRLTQKAHYNLGNAYYRAGILKEDADLDAAIEHLERALAAYENVLASAPENEDAKVNQAFVKEELERLKKKQKRKEEEQQKKKFQKEKEQKEQDEQKEKQEQESSKEQQKENQTEDQKVQEEERRQGSASEQPQPSGAKEDETQDNPQEKDASSAQPAGEKDSAPGASPKEEEQEQSPPKSSAASDSAAEEKKEQNDESSESQGAAGAGSVGAGEEQGPLTRKEAQIILRNYQREEEPQGLLNLRPRQLMMEEVEKDW